MASLILSSCINFRIKTIYVGLLDNETPEEVLYLLLLPVNYYRKILYLLKLRLSFLAPKNIFYSFYLTC